MTQNSKEHLPAYRVRPRFKIAVFSTTDQLVEKIKSGLEQDNTLCNGWVSKSGYGSIYLPYEQQHYWSPQLSITIENTDNGCLLSGYYGPRPKVWTMFIFFYFIIAFATVIISIIGLSNIYLNKPAMILWLVPVLVLIFLSLFLVAYLGQKLGRDQMIILHNFLEESTGLIIRDE